MHGGGKKIFMENMDLGARNNSLKFPPPNRVLHLLWKVLAPENRFFAHISINMSPRGKLQDASNIPQKISYMLVSLKVNLGLLVRRKTSLEITNFVIFVHISEEKTYRRNFRTIKFVCYQARAHNTLCIVLKSGLSRVCYMWCVFELRS